MKKEKDDKDILCSTCSLCGGHFNYAIDGKIIPHKHLVDYGITMNEDPAPSRDTLRNLLRNEFPNGHSSFIDIVLKILELHSKKNADYTKGGTALGNFTRVANIMSNYPNFPYDKPIGVSVMYMMKQFDVFLWMLCQGYDGKIEGKMGRIQDVSVYSLIDMCMLMDEQDKRENEEDMKK